MFRGTPAEEVEEEAELEDEHEDIFELEGEPNCQCWVSYLVLRVFWRLACPGNVPCRVALKDLIIEE